MKPKKHYSEEELSIMAAKDQIADAEFSERRIASGGLSAAQCEVESAYASECRRRAELILSGVKPTIRWLAEPLPSTLRG